MKPLTVCIVTSSLRAEDGGWARYSRDLVRALRADGFIVRVYTQGKRSEPPFEFEGALVRPGLATRAAFTLDNPFARFYHGLSNLIGILADWLWLRNEIRDADVVHACAEQHMFSASFLGKPYIVTAHGTYAPRLLAHLLYAPLARRALRLASSVICVSRFTRDRVAAHAPLPNLVVIGNGVNAKDAEVAGSTDRDPHLLLGVGAVKHRKGFHEVVKALPLVAGVVPGVRYVIAGDASNERYRAEIEELAREKGVGTMVEVRGSVPAAELDSLYRTARAFVLTPISVGERFEGFVLAYLEANAYGLPVVGMRGSGAEEAIADGKSGFLVKEGDTAALTEAILRLMTDDALWARMSEGALAWAREHAWERVVKLYEERYREAVRASKPEAAPGGMV